MNKELWAKIEAFQLDKWTDEYGFVLRLAKENLWTKHFTESAILEYKKFMYLAATSNQMVSPSDIVDIVWHQHLIFTQSYNRFCKLLGKDIQHIPSTHNRTEIDKFREAKEQTTTLYTKAFGAQPKEIWEYRTMYDSLNIKPVIRSLVSISIASIILFVVFIPIAFALLLPFYIHIGSSVFMFTSVLAFVGVIILLQRYPKSKIQQIFTDSSPTSFINDLHPYELMYLKHKGVKEGVIGTLNELIEQGNIKIGLKDEIVFVHDHIVKNREQAIVLQELKTTEVRQYKLLVDILKEKTVFINQQVSMKGLLAYLKTSDTIAKICSFNNKIIGVLTLLVFTRLIIGISRDKPVLMVAILTFILILYAIGKTVFFLENEISTGLITYYKDTIIPKKSKDNNWQWSYLLNGNTALGAALIGVFSLSSNYSNSENSSSENSCNSSSDNSYSSDSGSSCGSSCGGCGGGGD
ncbi:DUF1399 domain-containing protein [Myroides odoratimimus]|uniref:glycine-rich domain-containing protein n=1 Tax=Myroides odoratimimus TaxID=76832 RepID=UPI002DB94D01|nr:DUF1399 domain-containing protein [Myroides odoratimimus]MEC4052497.1 DUF1399 domain-containing protein [Myroides odoratimimus]